MLSLGRNLLDMTCMKNVYHGHIHSHILYGLLVWGSMASQHMISEIYKIQKQCICIMMPVTQKRDILRIFKDLCLMTVYNMIQISMCKLGHNFAHKHFPSPIVRLFDMFGGCKAHRYPTRNKHIPNLQQHQSERYHSSYLCRSIIKFNKLPLELKSISKTSIFLKQLRKHVNED